MQTGYSAPRTNIASAPVVQSAASKNVQPGESVTKRRMTDLPSTGNTLQIPIVGIDSEDTLQSSVPKISSINDIFRDSPCMG